MYIFNQLIVKPKLPNNISEIENIANNLWWSWNTEFLRLFKLIDKDLWNNMEKNPVKFLKKVSQEKLEKASIDPEFLKEYEIVKNNFLEYMKSKNTLYNKEYNKNKVIAYFSAEYGLDETVPIYSGGLGILSGDHLKSSSDLGIPLIAIGLLYKEGYFIQKIDSHGNQINSYYKIDVDNMPIFPVLDENDDEVKISVQIGNEEVFAKVWEVKVGRVKLYLLDTDTAENTDENKLITYRLYGGDKKMRIAQEVLLGIGGVRALEKLNITPDIYHMNEGHSAFLILELLKNIITRKQVSFNVAKEIVKAQTAFTTHTAVPAGIDIFDVSLIEETFKNIYETFGISKEEFLSFGMTPNDTYRGSFNMGVFAIKFSGIRNGVSKLHKDVSKELFNEIWPNISNQESPITYVTNGIHTTTWLAPVMKELYNKEFKPYWQDEIHKDATWKSIYNVSDEKIYNAHKECKKKLIREIQKNIKTRFIRNGESYDEINETISKISENDLIIGFARRFATYKRATMIFEDLERLTQILNDEKRPVKLVFAGKAHPADIQGQELIKRIHEVSKMPQFKGKIILLENYSMGISRYLVSGVDIWLNNPRRPLEASGTSGQKAAANGTLNFSVLDGWWEEGYNGKNGWSIGTSNMFTSEYEQDKTDSTSIYDVLENEIIPIYFEKEENKEYSKKFVQMMKENIYTNGGMYSSNRMLVDYLDRIYMPLINITESHFNNLEKVLDFRKWKKLVKNTWDQIRIYEEEQSYPLNVHAGEKTKLNVTVDFGVINKDNAKVEVYIVELNSKEGTEVKFKEVIELKNAQLVEKNVYNFKEDIVLNNGGNFAYTFRVVPKHDMLINFADLDAIKWYIKE